MSYSETVVRRAQLRLDEARSQNERDNAARKAAVYGAYPRLAEIDRELHKTAARVWSASFRAGSDPSEAVKKLQEENLELQREREWLLDSNDIDPEDLEDTLLCPVCRGTGWTGAVMCDCLKELCRQEQKKELTQLLGTGRESFDKFRLDVYPDTPDPRIGASPRELMKNTYYDAVQYARNFSPVSSPSLLFMGATGLGKTFLSACIARTVADRGFSVCYVTAEQLFSDFETDKFRPQEAGPLSAKYLSCDLLILDDLGTEMTTQFTISALYRLVNTRLMDSRPTIISSNIPVGDLEPRYSAQIASRLLGSYVLYKFYGKDIRMAL